jgi:hypothetical protein
MGYYNLILGCYDRLTVIFVKGVHCVNGTAAANEPIVQPPRSYTKMSVPETLLAQKNAR